MQKIILMIATVAIALFAFKTPSSFIVNGKVTDEMSRPVPFAAIHVQGAKTSVSANANGEFSIAVSAETDVLEFSSSDYETKSMVVGSQRYITIALKRKANVQDLKEVVVTSSYNVKRSETMSYSTQAVTANQLLTGQVAGVQVRTYTESKLGAASTVQLRGTNGLTGDLNGYNREGYDYITENSFQKVTDNPLSTFSIDVDAASYSNLRRFLNNGQLPPAGAVRIEEMVNYFKYEYPQPVSSDPFSVNTEIGDCPWNPAHRLALIGLQGKTIPVQNLPAGNIVFLIDVSGSMQTADKLPLLKQSLKLLVDQLREQDKVSLCVYAGNAGLVLPATNGLKKQSIKDAIDALDAGGSTAGGAGIQLAYKTARENFIKGGNNRVILCTDGDFNVGVSSDGELEAMIEKERESGVFLTVLGFGTGNYQDAKMQKLADKGNGNHAYIDQLSEAKKVLVSEFGGTLFTIAKDVKLQVEFNPALVQGYRLIGYENRMLAKEDFNDDKKDAGEMGSGHTVTALYEIIPVGEASAFLKNTDTLKYQQAEKFSASAFNDELMTVKLRYKKPDGNTSKLMEVPVKDLKPALGNLSDNYRFAAAVAEFGMLLRNSAFKQNAGYKEVQELAKGALGNDTEGYRKEFLTLVQKANMFAKRIERKKRNLSDPELDEDADEAVSVNK